MAASTMQTSSTELDDGAKAFLRSLPATTILECDGKRFMLCHAAPSDPLYGYCPEDSDKWDKEV